MRTPQQRELVAIIVGVIGAVGGYLAVVFYLYTWMWVGIALAVVGLAGALWFHSKTERIDS